MESLTTMVDTPPDGCATAAPALPVFPGRVDVGTALALFPAERRPDGPGRTLQEGPQWRLSVAPGVIRVASSSVAELERTAERAVEGHRKEIDLLAALGGELPERKTKRCIRVWSRKSRARMVRKLGSLDYSPLLDGTAVPAMVTLTYPGDWEAVAPDSETALGHLRKLRWRFERAYGVPLVAVWKREFQRRGAPHFHLLMVPPTELVGGQSFGVWLSRTWAAVVGHPDAEQRRRHELAGTGIDYAEGARALDPRRLGVYFAKHGAFADKEYQNEAAELWCHGEHCESQDCEGCRGVGRFWGYWHLSDITETIEVAPDVARAVWRTMRRHSRSGRYYVASSVWRKVTTVDRESGELGWKWRKRRTRVPIYRGKGRAGYIVYNDAPAFASELGRWASQVSSLRVVRSKSGAGPVGFLP